MVFWKKEKKEDYKVSNKLTGSEVLKKFLREADAEFVKVYCFPAFLACAYYFGSDDMKSKIEELIDEKC